MNLLFCRILAVLCVFSAASVAFAAGAPEYDVREESDRNADGTADCFVYLKDGQKVMEEIDSDFNGVVDMRRIYDGGHIVRTQALVEPQPESDNRDDPDIGPIEVQPQVKWSGVGGRS